VLVGGHDSAHDSDRKRLPEPPVKGSLFRLPSKVSERETPPFPDVATSVTSYTPGVISMEVCMKSTPVRAAALSAVALFALSVSTADAATRTTKKSSRTSRTTAAPTTAAATTAAPTTVAAPKNLDSTMLSTQFNNLEESENMRKEILKAFGGKIDFVTADAATFSARVQAEGKSGNGKVDVVGGLIGDLAPQAQYLKDLSGLRSQLAGAKINTALWDLGKLGTDKQLCIPWMNATLLMVVNKKALPYLPPDYDVNSLTHDQFVTWMNVMNSKTGKRLLGFGAGSSGLIHRYFQGYLLPSYTGSVNTKFASADAALAWERFREVWEFANPQSTTYNFLQDPLQSGEVWVGIDHVARIKDAVVKSPADFIAVPVPSGPKGRSYMSITGCLGVMSSSSNPAAAEELIKYLVSGNTPSVTLKFNGFYPPGETALPSDLSEGLKIISAGVSKQSSAKDAFGTLIPGGLGAKGGDYNRVWLDTFRAIVLQNRDIKETLADQKPKLQKVLDEANAPCWFPDPPSGDKPCVVG
jgi:multiple sugar transport system substrate-binding protein